MKNTVQMFEEFLCDPAQELALKNQFRSNNVTHNIPVTHNISSIVSDENGMRVEIAGGNNVTEDEVIEVPVIVEESENTEVTNEGFQEIASSLGKDIESFLNGTVITKAKGYVKNERDAALLLVNILDLKYSLKIT
jgi:hypothetical protein